MKKAIFISFLILIVVSTSGCLVAIKGQKITIQKQAGEEPNFEPFREVTKRKDVKDAIRIVKNAEWHKLEEERPHAADYQFQFPFKDDADDKIASYSLWINSEREFLEIVTDTYEYVQLSKQDSASLYRILIGEELNLK
ncbi:hypothetical protein [Sporosarcina sp. SAFN-010]|uniref:hypothetical protein n=1 Tax=Sporosarcina sp. SAFN-010 TaxID=3387273 RepID=UPI003F7F0C5E